MTIGGCAKLLIPTDQEMFALALVSPNLWRARNLALSLSMATCTGTWEKKFGLWNSFLKYRTEEFVWRS